MQKVLVVEDDKYLNKLLCDRLLMEGLEVTSCLDGEAAWEKLQETPNIDLLLVDMLLPRIMGAELLSRINERPELSKLRKIAISGVYKDENQIQEITQLHNLESYWTKPFDLDELIAKITGRSPNEVAQRLRSGSLHMAPIEKLYFDAYESGFTGKLNIQHQSHIRRIYFLNGHPVAADSNAISESFGSYLIASGQITETTREEISRRMVEEKALFGEMLVRMGLFEKDQVFALLRKHTYRLLLNSFLSRQGEFEFQTLEQIPAHLPRIEFNPFLLMLAAQSKLITLKAIESLVEIKADLYPELNARAAQLIPLLNLSSSVNAFFAKLKPNQNVLSTLADYSANDRESALRVLYLFESIEVLRWITPTEAQTDELKVGHIDFSASLGETKSAETTELEQEISSEYMDILNKNYFEILGLPTTANDREIGEAYRNLRFKKHPDRYEALSGQAKRILDDILMRLDQAHQVLSDPAAREEYIQSINRLSASSIADSQRYLEALDYQREGQKLLAQGLFEEAKEKFERAHQTWKSGIEYRAYSLYAQLKIYQKKGDRQAMSRVLHELRELAYSHLQSEICFVLLGHAYKSTEQRDAAREAYRKALELNVHSTEAENSLASLADKPSSTAAWNKEIHVSKTSAFKGFGYLVGSTLAIAGAFYASQLRSKDEGVMELGPATIKNILPATQIRHKNDTTKIFLQKDAIATMPDAVLKSKCAQSFEKLSPYGSMRLYLFEEEKGLSAICTHEKLQRF